MAYKIYKSDGQEVIIQDGVSSEPFSIDFVGRNTVNYGATIATTQLHLLENFANDTEPADATRGQLWFDTVAGVLKVNSSPNIIPVWNRLVTAEANNDLGTAQNPFNTLYANYIMSEIIGSPATPVDHIYANNFHGGIFTGIFQGNTTSATTASTLLNTRVINVTGGATGSVNLNLNSNTPPYTVDLPLTVNKLSTPVTISLSGGATGSALFDGSSNITIPTVVPGSGHTHNVLMAANTTPTTLSVTVPATATSSLKTYFTTANNGMSGAGTSYADLVLLNTASSAAGGMINALEFDKNTKTIRHWQALPGATNWGTPRTLAYTDYAAGSLTPGFKIKIVNPNNFADIYGQSAQFNGNGDVLVPMASSPPDTSKLPLIGGTMTGTIMTNSQIVWDGAAGIDGNGAGGLRFAKYTSLGAFQSDIMTLSSSGNLLAIGNVGAYSDARLKTNIELIPDALDKVCSLRGVTYDRIDTKERQTGVIAQDVQAVLPEAVIEGTDDNKTLSVAYGNMAGLFIEAFKEMRAEIDTLKAELKKFQN